MQITISKGQGITQAIKAQILASGAKISNNDLSVWQEVMQEVKTANDNRAEGVSPFYTGEGDVSKIGDKSTFGKDFKTTVGQVIELADNVWNKIVGLLTGKTPENVVKEQPPAADPTVVKNQNPDVTVEDEKTPDETPEGTLRKNINEDYAKKMADPLSWREVEMNTPLEKPNKDNVDPKPDNDKNLVKAKSPEKPPVTGPVEGENPEYDAIVKGTAPENDKTKGTKPEVKQYTPEEIQNKIDNLKPGQTFEHSRKSVVDWGSGSRVEQKSITWQRNDDNTLTKIDSEFSQGRFNSLRTNYEADGKTKISEEVINRDINSYGGRDVKPVKSVINYKDGAKETRVTDFSDKNAMNVLSKQTNMPATTILHAFRKNADDYSSQVVNNKKGEALVTYKDGKYFDKKGKEIDSDKANNILEKAFNKKQLGQMIQNYSSKEVSTTPKTVNNDEVKGGQNTEHTSPQKLLTPEQLEEFLANDTTYQGYDATLQEMDNRMSEIEAKYGLPKIRDTFKDAPEFGSEDWKAEQNIMAKPEQPEYTKLKVKYSTLRHQLGLYKKEMQKWVDGPLGEGSFCHINNLYFTNLERITLKDGRRAWKTDQGTFLPGPDGMPGGQRIDNE